MNHIFLKRSALVLFFLSISVAVQAQPTSEPADAEQPTPSTKELLKWEESFTYEVRYSFFKLGEVEVEIVSDTLYNGEPAWHLRTIITSNPGIPFVGREENHYHSIFRDVDNTYQVQEYWSDNVDEDIFQEEQYLYDRKKDSVYAILKNEPDDTLALEEPALTGHALFYISRLAAGTDSVQKFALYLNKEKRYLTLNSTTETEMRSYDAFDGEVKTYYSHGSTDVDGPFGFSGEFESWYLANDLRVPVEARVKVWLGKAKIRLIDYKKERRK